MGDEWEWKLTIEPRRKGGPGSGHWGHAGRPGQVGGSVSGSVAMSVRTGRTARERQQAARERRQSGGPSATLYAASTAAREEAEDWGTGSIQRFAERAHISYEMAEQRIFEALKADLDNSVIIRRGMESSRRILEEAERI